MNIFTAIFHWFAQNGISLILAIAALGIVVFLHELGHFIVAKKRGVRVEVFSIGFPPVLFSFNRGGTEYRISWLLLGGYVKLAGMEFDEAVDPRSVKDGYYASPLTTRIAVCSAGPLMNIISAFLIYTFLFFAGFPVPGNMEQTVVGRVMENSPAAHAGLQPGDTITRVEGKAVSRWEEVTRAIIFSRGEEVALEWERDSQTYTRTITPERDERLKLKRIGILPREYVSVDVLPGSIAAHAGMRNGDFILRVNGNPLYSWTQLVDTIHESEGERIRLGIVREGNSRRVMVIPRHNPEIGSPAIGIKVRRSISMNDLIHNGLADYVYRSPVSWISRNLREMYLTLNGLFHRTVSPRGLAGPIGIIQMIRYSMEVGLRQLLYVIAFISVNLAVLNLLPVPVLDGGHIVLALVEGVKRKPLSSRTIKLVQNIFLVILVALMLYIVANDIIRSWGETLSRLLP